MQWETSNKQGKNNYLQENNNEHRERRSKTQSQMLPPLQPSHTKLKLSHQSGCLYSNSRSYWAGNTINRS